MKRKLHIHIAVDDLAESMAFYSGEFDAKPTKIKDDYVQWIVEDLSLNFAISTRGYEKGINHLGIQYDSDEALLKSTNRLKSKGIFGEVEDGATCCYKKSNKYWLKDPTGIVWENYYSMEDIELFGKDEKESTACCSGEKDARI